MDNSIEKDPITPDPQDAAPTKEPFVSSTPTYVRVLAFLGALAVIGLSVAYAWSIATGGIFRF